RAAVRGRGAGAARPAASAAPPRDRERRRRRTFRRATTGPTTRSRRRGPSGRPGPPAGGETLPGRPSTLLTPGPGPGARDVRHAPAWRNAVSRSAAGAPQEEILRALSPGRHRLILGPSSHAAGADVVPPGGPTWCRGAMRDVISDLSSGVASRRPRRDPQGRPEPGSPPSDRGTLPTCDSNCWAPSRIASWE